jgi:hypothetical protein
MTVDTDIVSRLIVDILEKKAGHQAPFEQFEC